MVMLPRVIGDSVREARLEARLSQAKLAHSCGLSRRHIVAIENHCNFTLAVLLSLTRGLPEFDIGLVLHRARIQQRQAEAAARTAASTQP